MPLTRNQQAVLQSSSSGHHAIGGDSADLTASSLDHANSIAPNKSGTGQDGRHTTRRDGPSRSTHHPVTPEKQRYSLRRGRTGTTQSPNRINSARLQPEGTSTLDGFDEQNKEHGEISGAHMNAETEVPQADADLVAQGRRQHDHSTHLQTDHADHFMASSQQAHHTHGHSNDEQQQAFNASGMSQHPFFMRGPEHWQNQPRTADFGDDVLMQSIQSMSGQGSSHEAFLMPSGHSYHDSNAFASGLAFPGGPIVPQHDSGRTTTNYAMAVPRQQPLSEEAFVALQAQMAGNMSPERQAQYHAAHFASQGTPHAHRQMVMHSTPMANRGMGHSGHGLSVPATVPRASSASQHEGGPSHGAEHHARTFSTDGLDAFLAAQQGRASSSMGDGTEGGGSAYFLPNHVARLQLHHGMPVATRRVMSSGDASMSMDYEQDHQALSAMNGSPIARAMTEGRTGQRDDMRPLMRQNPSLGQMGTVMSAHENMLRMNGGQMRPVDLASLEQMRALHHQQQQQQAGHFGNLAFHPGRAMSPGEAGLAPGTIMGNVSPHSSIATGRYAGDSSIDTSTDSISNSATTMSAVPSQASSISDDLLSLSSGGRRAAKGKTRLRNIDRKAICEAARNDPKVRQEDLAARFGIERSTVSKTLKNKDKWLAIDDDSDGALIVKHRTGKFPEVEERLHAWLQHEHTGGALSDAVLRGRSLEIAREIGFGQDQFKASLGWIEKFRERYRIPKPITQETDMQDFRRGAQPFNSMVPLSAHHHSENRYIDEIEPAHFAQGDARLHRHEHDVDVAMFASHLDTTSPDDAMQMLPSASTPQRPRSASHEGALVNMHETPKASKRHYDDISAANREQASAEASAAHAQHSGSDTATSEHSPADSHGGQHGADESGGLGGDLIDSLAPSSAPKRRRAAQAQADAGRGADGGSLDAPTQEMGPPSARRSLRNRTIEIGIHQPSAGQSTSNMMPSTSHIESGMPDRSTTPRGTASSSRTQLSPSDATSPLRQGSLSGLISSQLSSADGISHSALANTMSMLAEGKTSGGGEHTPAERDISIDEARESLDVLMSFVTRQPAGISPSDYFVLGNLQGMLSQLANQSRQGTPQAISSGTASTSAGATPAMQASTTFVHDETEMHDPNTEHSTGR